MFKQIFLLPLSSILFVGCGSNSYNSKEELWAYLLEDNHGYHQSKEINGLLYELTYKPTDLLVEQELNEIYSADEVQSLRDKYGDYLYFNLSISSHGKELLSQSINREAFGEMVNQLAFGMEQKLTLITQKQDTIPLQDYVYPRLYGMGNSTDLLLVYENNLEMNDEEILRLTIEDFGFSTGEVSFQIPTQSFKEQPQLKF